MRQLFFKDESGTLTGDGDFTGTFHLFKAGPRSRRHVHQRRSPA